MDKRSLGHTECDLSAWEWGSSCHADMADSWRWMARSGVDCRFLRVLVDSVLMLKLQLLKLLKLLKQHRALKLLKLLKQQPRAEAAEAAKAAKAATAR
jgi:hypothetical protein